MSTEREWSPYQLNIFNFVSTDPNDTANMALYNYKRNATINAVAGSGKSTTIIEAIRRIPFGHSSIFLAFNKAIADELKNRGVNARTFHSLTFGPVMSHKKPGQKRPEVDTSKLRDIVDAMLTGAEIDIYRDFVCRLVSLGRNAGIGCQGLAADTPDVWRELAEYHDLELGKEGGRIERGVQLASMVLQSCCESPQVDYDDMLYLAVRDGLLLPKFDFVFVDEAQDTNAIQRALLRKIIKPTTRIIAVGDPAQSIYGFRGADSDSMKLIAQEFDCVELPLTVSYRCPRAVVAHAQQWVEHIESAPNAPEGRVTSLGQSWKYNDFERGNLIVCRTTKPLVVLAFALLKRRIAATIMGKDIGAGLIALIGKMNAKGIEQLMVKIDTWANREYEKAIAAKQEAKAEAIMDKRDVLHVLIDGLLEGQRTVPALIQTIEGMFSNQKSTVTLATIHKAKGLEAERVFWLNSSKCPAQWAKQLWQQEQEINLCYVATTRAKVELVLIEEQDPIR
jgi:DNA helicase II / ATP-dependent DNA helicase PcrA